jgi:cell division protein FtsB
MSRSAAGQRRTIAPPMARRVSGPAALPRQEPGGQPPRAPRASIDAAALAYPEAVAVPRPRARPRPPAAPRRRSAPVVRAPRAAYGGVAIAQRCASVAIDVSASRAMDRLVRSRVWIGIIAFGLIGIVATQVSLLKLNSGIGRAVQTVSTLERSNASLRREISRLSAGERIQPLAEAKGFVMPAPKDVRYLTASSSTSAAARRAVRRMRPPGATATGFGTSAGITGLTAPPAPAATGAAAPAPEVTPTATNAAPAATPTSAAAPVTAAAPAIAQQTTAPPATAASSGGATVQQATATTP